MQFLESLCFPAVLLVSLASCNGFVFFSSDGRVLIAVHVDPSTADPITFPDGQVQFSASGTFNAAPTLVDPLPSVIWTVDRSPFSTGPASLHASINKNGLAQCGPGFSGVVQVFATAPANPALPLSPSNAMTGTAQMKCP